MRDHPLCEEPFERLLHIKMSRHLHRPRKEARVEKVQDGMFNPANITIDRQPALSRFPINRCDGMRRRVTGEIPGTINERIESIRLPCRSLTALGASHVLPTRMVIQRIAGCVERNILRQCNRNCASGTGTAPHVAQWMIGIGQPQ